MLVSNIKHDLVVVSSQELFYNFPDRVAQRNRLEHLYPMYRGRCCCNNRATSPQGTQRPHPLPGDRRRVSPYTGFAAQMGWLTLVITLTKALHRVSTLTCSGDTLCSPSQGIPCKGKILPTPFQPPRTQWLLSKAVCLTSLAAHVSCSLHIFTHSLPASRVSGRYCPPHRLCKSLKSASWAGDAPLGGQPNPVLGAPCFHHASRINASTTLKSEHLYVRAKTFALEAAVTVSLKNCCIFQPTPSTHEAFIQEILGKKHAASTIFAKSLAHSWSNSGLWPPGRLCTGLCWPSWQTQSTNVCFSRRRSTHQTTWRGPWTPSWCSRWCKDAKSSRGTRTRTTPRSRRWVFHPDLPTRRV